MRRIIILLDNLDRVSPKWILTSICIMENAVVKFQNDLDEHKGAFSTLVRECVRNLILRVHTAAIAAAAAGARA